MRNGHESAAARPDAPLRLPTGCGEASPPRSEMFVPREYAHHLLLKIGGRIGFVRTSEIRYVEAARDYVRLHTGSATFVLKGRISDLEQRLDPSRFLRIHRSYIAAIDRIADIRPVAYGDYAVVVEGGASIPLSRSHRSQLTRLLTKVG